MFVKHPFEFLKDRVWSKVITFCLVIFFIFLGDAILSFWVPNLLKNSLKSSAAMGFIISFSAVIGLGTDLVLPQLLKGITVKKLLILGIITSIIFSIALLESTYMPIIGFFLFAMAVWGLYYEFVGFAEQQFVADTVPLKLRAGAWGILRVFRDLAYFLGPMIAGWLLLKNERMPAIFAIFFVVIGFLILKFSGKIHDRPMEVNIKEVNLFKEIEHWAILFKHVWPVITLSVLLGLIDATFWTIGAVWTQTLSQKSFWGTMFLPFYTLPAFFTGFVIAKWGVYKGKKRLAMKFLLVAGIFLALLGLSDSIPWQLIMVLLSGTMLTIVYPLTDGVYTDITARMGRERKHMIGLSNSTSSLAYIIGPILAGLTATAVGERYTFVVAGVVAVVFSIILLTVTPKKLKLPQKEISTWEGK